MDPPSAYAGTRPGGKVPAAVSKEERGAIMLELAELLAMGYDREQVPGLFMQMRGADNARRREAGQPERPVPLLRSVEDSVRDAEEKILGLAREPRERAVGRQLFRLQVARNKAAAAGKWNAVASLESQIARVKGTYAPVRVTIERDERYKLALEQMLGGISLSTAKALVAGERPPLGAVAVIDAEGVEVE